MTRKRSLGHNPLGESSGEVSLQELVGRAEDPAPGETALALFGRGADAAAEVGVVAGLIAGESPATGGRPLRPCRLLGSCFGAFDAAYLAAKWDEGADEAVASLEKVWRQRIAASPNGVFRLRGDPSTMMNPAQVARHPVDALRRFAGDGAFFARDWFVRSVDFMRSSSQLSHRMLALADLTSLVSTAPLKELLENAIRPGDIAASSLPVEILATPWSSGRTRRLGAGELGSAEGLELLRGALSPPGVFPAVEARDESWTDGSLHPDPLASLLEGEVETIHLVEPAVAELGREWQCSTLGVLEEGSSRRTRTLLEGCLERIARSNRARVGRAVTVHRHRPEIQRAETPSALDFSKKRIQAAIREGRRAAATHDCEAAGCVLAESL